MCIRLPSQASSSMPESGILSVHFAHQPFRSAILLKDHKGWLMCTFDWSRGIFFLLFAEQNLLCNTLRQYFQKLIGSAPLGYEFRGGMFGDTWLRSSPSYQSMTAPSVSRVQLERSKRKSPERHVTRRRDVCGPSSEQNPLVTSTHSETYAR